MRREARFLCPVAGCGGGRLRWQVVCRACWRRLPRDLRDRIAAHRDRAEAHLRARAGEAAVAWLAAEREAVMRVAPG